MIGMYAGAVVLVAGGVLLRRAWPVVALKLIGYGVVLAVVLTILCVL